MSSRNCEADIVTAACVDFYRYTHPGPIGTGILKVLIAICNPFDDIAIQRYVVVINWIIKTER